MYAIRNERVYPLLKSTRVENSSLVHCSISELKSLYRTSMKSWLLYPLLEDWSQCKSDVPCN